MPERYPNTQDPSTSCWAVFFGVLVHLPQEKSRGPMMNFPSCSCACAVDIATASASTASRSSWYMVLSAHVPGLIEFTGRRGRGARPEPPGVGIRAAHPAVQGLLFHGGGVVSLAMLLLPELFARPDAGLDERHLSAVGRRSRHHDRHASELVSGLVAAQAHDGPPRLRRRRQS